MENSLKEFIEQIKENLKQNGFPEQKVAFQTEKMYEIADSKGFSLNKVLELLKKESIYTEILTEKIVFSSFPDQLDTNNIYQQAQDILSKMSPEEIKTLQEKIGNMSQEEKEQIMKKGKEVGL